VREGRKGNGSEERLRGGREREGNGAARVRESDLYHRSVIIAVGSAMDGPR